MDRREQSGRDIAATLRLERDGAVWIVPSRTGSGRYTVDPDAGTCSCPDYELRRRRCKHLWAVEFALSGETDELGDARETTVTETLTVSKSVRVTYRQDWPAYNAAQTAEKATFVVLLRDLCRGVPQPVQTFGRPRLPLSDIVFSAVFKVYSTFSGRRFMSDLTDACAKGCISKVPHYNSIFHYFEAPDLTPVIRHLITVSSLPLKAVESDFAVDSSGFSASRFVRWYNVRYGHEQDNHDWVKVHIMCGVKTNIVTSVEVTGRYAHDAPVFPALAEATARNFRLAEVSADKAYSSRANLEIVPAHGATPYIAYKSSATGGDDASALWSKMWHYYSLNRDDFLAHYHKRSNVESTFSMIKAKFGDGLRSKTDVALVNEALCKVLCHNICVLIQSMHELGIEPTFWAESELAQKVGY